MWYIEFLRARKALSVYGAMLLVLFVVALLFRLYGTFHRYGADRFMPVPIEVLASMGAFITAIFATTLATSLAHHVAGHLEIAWTKPISRDRFILEVLLVDASAIAIAYVGTMACMIATFMVFSGRFPLVLSPLGIARTALELVFVYAFYMVIQAATSGQRRFAGMIAGVSWPVLLLVMAAPSIGMPAPITRFFELIDFVNPLALLSVRTASQNMLRLPIWGAPAVLDACALIAIGFAITLVRWRRIEA